MAVGGSSPYVIRAPHKPDGISVQVWELVAAKLDIESTYSVFPSSEEALAELEAGRADVVVGPILMSTATITEFNLSVPYFVSRMAMLSRERPITLMERVRPFISRAVFISIVTLAVLVTAVGLLVWLAERRPNSDMFPPGHFGLQNGIWFAVATLSGVGYGDVVPRTVAGRSLASLWMIVTTLFFSTVTAGITTAITLSHLPRGQVVSLHNLEGSRVAVVAGSEGDSLMRLLGVRAIRTPNVTAAVDLLERDEVDVIVFSEPALEYTIRVEHRTTKFVLTPATDELTYYCFATAKTNYDLADRIDRKLVRLNEEDQLHTTYERWLGTVGR